MERSEILEALDILNRYWEATRLSAQGGVLADEVEDAIDALNSAHDFDPRENWWEQV